MDALAYAITELAFKAPPSQGGAQQGAGGAASNMKGRVRIDPRKNTIAASLTSW